MFTIRIGIFLALFVILVGCSQVSRVTKNENVALKSKIAVIPFRDCIIPGQQDCLGSGNVAGSVFAQILANSNRYSVSPISRPVAANLELTDENAVEYARKKGFNYVINGEVNDYFSVTPMTFRPDRAGISARLLNVSSGSVALFQTAHVEGANYKTPADLIEEIAEELKDALCK